MSKLKTAIVWLRNDLRIADNPALRAAATEAESVIPVFVYAPAEDGRWAPGGASKWWLHHSLADLANSLDELGSPLVIRSGDTSHELFDIARQTGAECVYFNRAPEPAARRQEDKVQADLEKKGVRSIAHQSNTLLPPDAVRTGKDEPYKVFTPYWRGVLAHEPAIPQPLPKLRSLQAPAQPVTSMDLRMLFLLPKIRWDKGIEEAWEPGEAAAHKMLKAFTENALMSYEKGRDFPADEGVSRLSPYLHFGEISPRQIWHELREHADNARGAKHAVNIFLRQIVWREFAQYLLYHYPQTAELCMREEFNEFPWHNNKYLLERWHKGETGFPIVDAGMRELWTTGWMHNRVRMIVASFLVKDLLIPWQRGAEWFWDTLVDADLGNNTMGWQWVAGCGADAAPYFRVFNPVLQGEKFDPNGDYIRRWVPELANVDGKVIHKPWIAGVKYYEPLVDHAEARTRALSAYSSIRNR